jgi:hypothetical protein
MVSNSGPHNLKSWWCRSTSLLSVCNYNSVYSISVYNFIFRSSFFINNRKGWVSIIFRSVYKIACKMNYSFWVAYYFSYGVMQLSFLTCFVSLHPLFLFFQKKSLNCRDNFIYSLFGSRIGPQLTKWIRSAKSEPAFFYRDLCKKAAIFFG